MQTVKVSEGVMGPVITIDGVKYLRQESEMADCDGNEIFLGQDVYIRASVLDQYSNLNKSNRHGKLVEKVGEYLDIELDDGRRWNFPVNHIRQQS
jgi:hypothetical protein